MNQINSHDNSFTSNLAYQSESLFRKNKKQSQNRLIEENKIAEIGNDTNFELINLSSHRLRSDEKFT